MDIVQKVKGTFDNQMFAYFMKADNNVLYVNSKKEYTNTDSTIGSIHAFTLPECTTSPDCPMQTGRLGRCVSGQGTPNGQYCQCEYPYEGLRCAGISTDCSDGSFFKLIL